MSWNYTNIRDYVDQADRARKEIVQTCHDVGYIIPTDEMRTAAGEKPITITDIPNWLYRLNQAVLVATTTSVQKIQLQSWLLDNIPDLKVKWDWTGSETDENELEPASKYLSDGLIQYDYGFIGNHKFALFSPSRLEKVSPYAFLNNNMIKEVELTPVISELASSSFHFTTNLDTVTFGPNIKTIRERAFYITGMTSVSLPKSVERIYGPDNFYCPLTSFVIPEDSSLKELHGQWIFDFEDRKSADEYIYVPAGCKFYDASGMLICHDNVESNIMTQNPFSRACNHFRFGGNTAEDALMSDAGGAIYLKDDSSNPVALMYYPADDTLDSYAIPSTVKYIAHSALMSVPHGQTLTIPSTIEYIHPYFLYWSGQMMKFSSASGRYKTTQYGGLMTYSTTDFSGEPDVILHEAAVTLDTYEFPSNFSSLKDFRSATVNATNLIHSNSSIQNVKLNRGFPVLPVNYLGPFQYNPKQQFQYSDVSCDNYTIEDGGKTLYVKSGDNLHNALVGVSYDIESFSIHEDCKYLYNAVFCERNGLSGTLDLGNVVDCEAYNGFYGMNNVETIRFGNELICLNGYGLFVRNKMSELALGTDESSELRTVAAITMFGSNPNLSSIWMPGLNVTQFPAGIFGTRTESEPVLSIHVHFWADSTKMNYSTTYKTMKAQKYTETEPYNRVIMVDIPW